MFALGLAACAALQLERATGHPPIDSPSAAEISEIIASLDRWNTPCAFRVEITEMVVSRASSFARGTEWLPILEVARRAADSRICDSRGRVFAAFDRLVLHCQVKEPGVSMRTRNLRVACWSGFELQVNDGDFGPSTEGVLRTGRFNLLYKNYHGRDHYLEARPFSRSPLLYDIETLLHPVMLDEASQRWWGEFAWEVLASTDAQTRCFRIRDNGTLGRSTSLEIDARTGLPLAASYCVDPSAPENLITGLFCYAPLEVEKACLWLSRSLTITFTPERIILSRAWLSEIDFDVLPEDLSMHVLAGTPLTDERTPNRLHFGSETSDWPREILEHVVFHTEVAPSAEPDQEESADAQELPSRPLRYGGLVLLVLGLLGLFQRVRAKERSA